MDCSWMGWCALRPEAQAAWVQAVGSVAAIVVAVLVPIWISRTERARLRREHYFRARSLAFVIRPIVSSVIQGIHGTRERWRQDATVFMYDDAYDLLDRTSRLSDYLMQLHEIGNAGVEIQHLLVAVDELRNGLEEQVDYWRNGGVRYHYETREEIELPKPPETEKLFDDTSTAAVRALDSLEALLR